MRNHAGVNANLRILRTIDQPFSPIFGTIDITCGYKVPVVVQLTFSLDPVPRVGDEVRSGL